MGRSVSSPRDALWTHYGHIELEDDCDACDWQDFIGCLTESLMAAFPSLYETREWIGREDRALAANAHATIGVSEYCGLVSFWCVPADHPEHGGENPLAIHWCESIRDRAELIFSRHVSTSLSRIGTFSNGEGVYSIKELVA